jgi:hypothetical protein
VQFLSVQFLRVQFLSMQFLSLRSLMLPAGTRCLARVQSMCAYPQPGGSRHQATRAAMALDFSAGVSEASLGDVSDMPIYRVCKFCHRSSRTPNPLTSYVPGKFLKWRRCKGRECASCPWFIASEPEYASLDKAALEGRCMEEQFRTNYLKKLTEWEKHKNETGGERKPGPSKGNVQVVAHATDKIQARVLLGWIWPKAIYEMVEGKKLEKKQIKSFRVGDMVYRGVLRDKAGPPGCIEYSKISDAGATISGTLATSCDEVENEVEQAWSQAAKRTRTVVKPDAKNPDTYKVTVSAAQDGDDSSDEDGILDAVWGRRMQLPTSRRRRRKDSDSGASDGQKKALDKDDDKPKEQKRRTLRTN